ncbi:MAG: nuclear transport factor 2 family protein [Shewanella sp.]
MMASKGAMASANTKVVDEFIRLYQALNKDNLPRLAEVYADNIVFVDPLHRIEGLQALTRYFGKLYENIKHIEFDIKEIHQTDTQAALYWQMHYAHPKLNQGALIRVDGMSQLKFSHKIEFHRDYFDIGQMLYEQLPCMGPLIRAVKVRVAK